MSLGFYGQTDRQLLREINKHAANIEELLGTLATGLNLFQIAILALTTSIQSMEKEILGALKEHPVVTLKFTLGTAVDK